MQMKTVLNKNSIRLLAIGGIVGAVGSGVAVGICTYKSYPDIKKGMDEGENPFKIAKTVAKNYIPALAIGATSIGLMVAGEIFGEQKVKELEARCRNAQHKFYKATSWYQDKAKAMDILPEKEKKKVLEKEKELNATHTGGMTDILTLYDPLLEMEFKTTERELYKVLDKANKMINLETGYFMLKDFYYELGVTIPEKFSNYGWSLCTASAQWVDAWLDLKFIPVGDKITINFIADRGDGEFYSFEPVEDPESDAWC